jgi:hypothetical protein
MAANSSLPLISKLSDGDSPDAGSEDDIDVEDDEDLGALALQMGRTSVVGASSGRGLKTRLHGDSIKALGSEIPICQTT